MGKAINAQCNNYDDDHFIGWLYGQVGKVQQLAGLTEQQATCAVQTIVKNLEKEYGGQQAYIKRTEHTKKAKIEQLLKQGLSVDQVMQRCNVTRSYVNRINRLNRNN